MLQKKEPVGSDESVPESAQNLDELTADVLGVSLTPPPRSVRSMEPQHRSGHPPAAP